MEKEPTPLMELIEYCDTHEGLSTLQVIAKATSLLPKEREAIENAYERGYTESVTVHHSTTQDNYFDRTFKTP